MLVWFLYLISHQNINFLGFLKILSLANENLISIWFECWKPENNDGTELLLNNCANLSDFG